MGVSAFHADTMLWADKLVRVRGVCEVTPSMASIVCFLATSGISYIEEREKGTHKPSLGNHNNLLLMKFHLRFLSSHPRRRRVSVVQCLTIRSGQCDLRKEGRSNYFKLS